MWLCKRDLSKECKGKYKDCTDCILDKIRAEIEQIYQEIDTVSHDEYENAVEQGKERAYENVLAIIDNYKRKKNE